MATTAKTQPNSSWSSLQGKTLGLIAPSGYPLEPKSVDLAAKYLSGQGLNVVAHDSVWAKYERFAGKDALRADAFNDFALGGHDVVMAVRGGYGLSRLLDQLKYKKLAKSGSLFMGHSDFTAFQLAYLAKTGQVSFAGPMACYDFGQTAVSAYTEQHCWGLLTAPQYEVKVTAPKQPKVNLQGTIWGGNLALLNHLVGTPYLPNIKQGILFIEDINEHPYRVERMIYQLLYAGVLDRQQALLLGDFSDYKLSAADNGYDFESMVAHLRERLPMPVLTGLPFGHIRDKLTIPVGATVALKSTPRGYSLNFSNYPYLD